MPELGNTNFEPVPFGGGSNVPPDNDNLNLNGPVYSPIMMALSKANLDPEKVRRIKAELNSIESSETHGFPKPMNIDDSSRFGGGGFIDSMTTNLERNMACVLNSMVMANVRVHCEELKQHPRFSGMSCELITLLLTEEMYELYKEKDPSFQVSQPEYDPLTNWLYPTSPAAEGISPMDAMRWAWVVKRALMKKYGVSIGKKRLSGYTPAPEGDPPTSFPEPRDMFLLPEHVIAYGMGSGRDDDGGPYRPIEASSGPTPMSAPNPANASGCCPPEGCIVVVSLAFKAVDGSYQHHQVMGEITKCEPLTIECFESPMQMPGGSYTLTVDHYRGETIPGMMGDFGFTREHTVATVSDISGGDQETRDALSEYSSAVIKSIVCFC